MEGTKEYVAGQAEAIREELIQLSHDIHSHPECGFEEYYACDRIAGLLRSHGFRVDTGTGGLATAFTAVKKSGVSGGCQNGPRIAFLAEYDALEGLGHGCGHNMIAAMAAGAGIALSSVLDRLGGTVYVIGTPGEETKGGKILMQAQGAFADVDYVLMCHPTSGPSMVQRSARGCTTVYAGVTGKSAHSSNPASGINALTAVRAAFSNIDLMHPCFRFQDTVNGVIRQGGQANNVIPGEASCEFCLRSRTLGDLERLVGIVKHCAETAAMLTGARADIHVDPLFSERYPNIPMGQAFKENLESLGEPVSYPDPMGFYGSSDVSNLSLHMPVIHEYISIAPGEVNGHSPEFAAAAASEKGDRACILGAKALAMTGFDILSSSRLQREIQEAFERQVPAMYRTQDCPGNKRML